MRGNVLLLVNRYVCMCLRLPRCYNNGDSTATVLIRTSSSSSTSHSTADAAALFHHSTSYTPDDAADDAAADWVPGYGTEKNRNVNDDDEMSSSCNWFPYTGKET